MEFLVLLMIVPFLCGDLFQKDDDEDPAPDINGSAGNDTMDGTERGEEIYADAGDDVITAWSGDDLVQAEEGDDLVLGEAGHDLIFGGAGDDLVDGGSGNDTIWLGDGADEMPDPEDGFDLGPDFEISAAGDDQVVGGAGNDFLIDRLGSNTLRGDLGDDIVVGVDDTGTTTPDQLFGGWGRDYLVGDDGDTLSGGGFTDEFSVVLNERDDAAVMITDFDSATETLFLEVDEQAFAGATGDDLVVQVDPATGDVSLLLQGQKVVHLVDPAGSLRPGSILLPEWMRPAA